MQKHVVGVCVGMMCALFLLTWGRAAPGREACVPRADTVRNECYRVSGGCMGVCYRLVFPGCNDCVEGMSTCPAPSTPCFSRVNTADSRRVWVLCLCSDTWLLGPLKPGSQQCGYEWLKCGKKPSVVDRVFGNASPWMCPGGGDTAIKGVVRQGHENRGGRLVR